MYWAICVMFLIVNDSFAGVLRQDKPWDLSRAIHERYERYRQPYSATYRPQELPRTEPETTEAVTNTETYTVPQDDILAPIMTANDNSSQKRFKYQSDTSQHIKDADLDSKIKNIFGMPPNTIQEKRVSISTMNKHPSNNRTVNRNVTEFHVEQEVLDSIFPSSTPNPEELTAADPSNNETLSSVIDIRYLEKTQFINHWNRIIDAGELPMSMSRSLGRNHTNESSIRVPSSFILMSVVIWTLLHWQLGIRNNISNN